MNTQMVILSSVCALLLLGALSSIVSIIVRKRRAKASRMERESEYVTSAKTEVAEIRSHIASAPAAAKLGSSPTYRRDDTYVPRRTEARRAEPLVDSSSPAIAAATTTVVSSGGCDPSPSPSSSGGDSGGGACGE